MSENLQAAGIDRPAGTQAHHIVGKSTDEGRKTQDLLKRLGIDINSSVNGVFLPGCGGSNAIGMIHCGRHTKEYEQAVWVELQSSKTKQQAIAKLQNIRDRLLENRFIPLNNRATK